MQGNHLVPAHSQVPKQIANAACIYYQIISHVSGVAAFCRFANAFFTCNAGFGSSLHTTSKA
jgi:hypothetical protein